ncbi:Hypothetical protein NTJ_09967 [Nesidiocoris tenuis]|uniref:Uncharacterized protein n=1 Tax=Nesidiocoris tenuis TaxID=355587 RepID=A0ABN7AYA5_9HEMI|nr:Hypothetical protein NTJ_09967 [Nesidiocoris tenuis]
MEVVGEEFAFRDSSAAARVTQDTDEGKMLESAATAAPPPAGPLARKTARSACPRGPPLLQDQDFLRLRPSEDL